MAQIRVLHVAKEFSRVLGPRHSKDGRNSAEEFRELLASRLKEAIKLNIMLVVVLDGATGYNARFLDEAFGGLHREGLFKPTEILGYMSFVSEENPKLIEKINNYISDSISCPSIVSLYKHRNDVLTKE